MPGKAGERHQTMTKTERHKHREREREGESGRRAIKSSCNLATGEIFGYCAATVMGLPRPERLATHLHSTAAVLRSSLPPPPSPLQFSLLPAVSCQELPSNWALSCLALKRCDNFLSNLKAKFLATWPALAAARVTCK